MIVAQHERARLTAMVEHADRDFLGWSPSPPITLSAVTMRYGQTRALDRLSAVIPGGQFVAVIGRSGAGKTTLLRCLTGAAPLTEGAIRFGAKELAALRGRALREHAAVGMVYQQFNLVIQRSRRSRHQRRGSQRPAS